MNDNGVDGDATAQDGIYSCIFPYSNSNSEVKFYIKAENSNAIRLSPERAEYQYYIYSKDAQIVENSNFILIYPNPAESAITIENNFSEQTNYSIYSSIGQVVKEGHINSTLFYVDISQLASNIYFLKIGSSVYKFIKN